MPKVDVLTESDTNAGWRFSVEIRSRRGGASTHDVTMSFQDYEMLCRGTRPPSDVIGAVVATLLSGRIEAAPKPLPASFDLATAFRWAATPADLI